MPPANGHAPLWTNVSFKIQNHRKSQPKNSKIHQVGSPNPSSWAPKSTKLGSKIKKNQSWEVSGGILGPSWPQDPPKTKIEFQKLFLGALLGIHFGGQNPPKSNKNRSWIALGNLSDIEA